MFSDALHGGKRKALKAAIAYRDALLNLNPAVTPSPPVLAEALAAR
jgi:hypothetical protein